LKLRCYEEPVKPVGKYFTTNSNLNWRKSIKTGENISIYVTTMQETGKTEQSWNLTAADPVPPLLSPFVPPLLQTETKNPPSLRLLQIANAFSPLLFFSTEPLFENMIHLIIDWFSLNRLSLVRIYVSWCTNVEYWNKNKDMDCDCMYPLVKNQTKI